MEKGELSGGGCWTEVRLGLCLAGVCLVGVVFSWGRVEFGKEGMGVMVWGGMVWGGLRRWCVGGWRGVALA